MKAKKHNKKPFSAGINPEKESWLKRLFHFFSKKTTVVEHIKPVMVPIHERAPKKEFSSHLPKTQPNQHLSIKHKPSVMHHKEKISNFTKKILHKKEQNIKEKEVITRIEKVIKTNKPTNKIIPTKQIKEKKKSITKLNLATQEKIVPQKETQQAPLQRIIVPEQPTNSYNTQENSTSSSESDDLTQLEEEALRAKKAKEELEAPEVKREQEKKIKELSSKITASRKVTDFDRILLAVNSHGTIKASELKDELRMNTKQFNECVKILHKNGDIQIQYPLLGSMKLVKVKKKIEEEVL